MTLPSRRLVAAASALLLLALSGCGDAVDPASTSAAPVQSQRPPPAQVKIRFACFATPREAYEKRIIPAFQLQWRKQLGEEVVFEQSYNGSRSQALAIAGGYEADVAALSLAEDLDYLVQQGLIRGPWRSAPRGGTVCRSLTVIAVRRGNPRAIRDWPDLLQPGLQVLLPDPKTSGGGRWDVCTIYGAALRGHAGVPADDASAAEGFLARVFSQLGPQYEDARRSFKAFEDGEGDAAITSESEVVRGRMFGHDFELVIPTSTMRVDNPAAVVDVNADKHGVRQMAEAFLEFLWSSEAQAAFAHYGFRAVDEGVAAASREQYPTPPDLWTVEDLGGWSRVYPELFAPGGVLQRASKTAEKRE